MITVNLHKEDLIRMLKGTAPSYEQMETQFCKSNGSFSGSYGRWDWRYCAFEGYTEEELWDEYVTLREGL